MCSAKSVGGQRCNSLWTEYKKTLSVESFKLFKEAFLAEYECGKGPVGKLAGLITLGHPTSVVVDVVRLFFANFIVEDERGAELGAVDWLDITRVTTNPRRSSPQEDTLTVYFADSILARTITASDLESESSSRGRSHFMDICLVLECICGFPHNRLVIGHSFGAEYFGRLTVEVGRTLASKIEEAVVSWSATAESKLLATVRFMLSTALVLTHLYSSGLHVPATATIDMTEWLGGSSVPSQPWGPSELEQMGIPLYGHHQLSHTIIDGVNVGTSTPPSFTRLYNHSSTTGSNSLGTHDPIVNSFCETGVVRTVISILRKVIQLSHSLSIAPRRRNEPPAEDSLQLQHRRGERSPMSAAVASFVPMEKSAAKREVWLLSLSLQCELLLSVIKYVNNKPATTLPQFVICGGTYELSSLLAMADKNEVVLPAMNHCVNPLLLLRGMLCLRMSEILLRMSVKYPDDANGLVEAVSESFANLRGFCGWIVTANIVASSPTLSTEKRGTSDDLAWDVKIGVQAPTALTMQPFLSDLWPWSSWRENGRKTSVIFCADASSASSSFSKSSNNQSYDGIGTSLAASPYTLLSFTTAYYQQRCSDVFGAGCGLRNNLGSRSSSNKGTKALPCFSPNRYLLLEMLHEMDSVTASNHNLSFGGAQNKSCDGDFIPSRLKEILLPYETSQHLKLFFGVICDCMAAISNQSNALFVIESLLGGMTKGIDDSCETTRLPTFQAHTLLFLAKAVVCWPSIVPRLIWSSAISKCLITSPLFLMSGQLNINRLTSVPNYNSASADVTFKDDANENWYRVEISTKMSGSKNPTDAGDSHMVSSEATAALPQVPSSSPTAFSLRVPGTSVDEEDIVSISNLSTIAASDFQGRSVSSGVSTIKNHEFSPKRAASAPNGPIPAPMTDKGDNVVPMVVIRDLVLELLWLSIECAHTFPVTLKADVSSTSKKGTAVLSPLVNVDEFVNLLSSGTSDDVIVQVSRWLTSLVHFHSLYRLELPLSTWFNIMTKAVAISRQQVSSVSNPVTKMTVSAHLNTNADLMVTSKSRQFHWPARVAVLQLMHSVSVSIALENWVGIFVPAPKTDISSDDAELNLPAGLNSTASTVSSFADGTSSGQSIVSGASLPQTQQMVRKGSLPPSVKLSSSSKSSLSNSSGNSLSKTASAALANQVKQQKHAVLLRLTLDWRACDVALFLLTRVFQYCVSCVQVEYHSIPFMASSSTTSAVPTTPMDEELVSPTARNIDHTISGISIENSGSGIAGRSSIHEALLHDIIRGLMSVVKNSSRQPQYIDGFHAAFNIMILFTAFLRDRTGSAEAPIIDRVFNTYGVFSANHQLFHWTHSRPTVFKDMLLSVEEALRHGRNWSSRMKGDIIRAAWALLTSLMIKSEKNKESFRQLMLQRNRKGSSAQCNYHDLAAIVTYAETPVTMETVLCLFQTMIGVEGFISHNLVEFAVNVDKPIRDGLFADALRFPLIVENSTVLPILMTLVPHCKQDLQRCILRSLFHLISGETAIVNMSRLTQMHPPLIELILDMFYLLPTQEMQVEALSLLKQLGQHSISVSQLKRIFRLMQLQAESFCRHPHVGVLLDCLAGMIDVNDGPKYFFHFQGQDSGLKLAPLNKWNTLKGYAFSVWFCIESSNGNFQRSTTTNSLASTLSGLMNVSSGGNSEDSVRASFFARASVQQPTLYEPVLLSMRQPSGAGIEILLAQNQQQQSGSSMFAIVVRSYTAKTMYQVTVNLNSNTMKRQAKTRSLRQKQWHHLAISHVASGFRSHSEMSILLDGDFVKERLPFPRFTEVLNSCMIGDRAAGIESDIMVGTSSAGNVVSTNVNVVSAFCGEMSNIYFFSEALSESSLSLIYSLGPVYSQLFNDVDAHLNSALMLTINPGVNRGDSSYLDNTPETNSVRWLTNSSLSSSADFVSAASLKGTFRCTTRDMRNTLDCLGGLKTLLPLFAQVDLPCAGDLGSATGVADVVDENICLKILSLIFELLRDSAENHKLMDGLGFSLVAYFLERISPGHLTLPVLECLVMHIFNLSWNMEWQDSAFKYILTNFKIWINTAVEVQKYLFTSLLTFTRMAPQRMAKIAGVQRLLDELYLRYVSPIARKSTDNKGKGTNEPVASLGPVTECSMYQLRCEICELIFIEVRGVDHSVCDDIHSIINYVLHETYPPYKVSGLQLLVRIISAQSASSSQSNQRLGQCLTSKRSIMGLLSLISHSRNKVRLYTLLALCSLVQVVVSKLGQLHPPATTRSSSTVGTSDKPKRSSTIGHLSARLIGFDSGTYNGHPKEMTASSTNSATSTHGVQPQNNLPRIGGSPRSPEPFEAIGISVNSLPAMFLWVQEALLQFLKNDFGGHDIICKQTEIIFCALQLTMHGLPCKNLVGLIENLFPPPFGHTGQDVTASHSAPSSGIVASQLATKNSFSSDELKDWSVSSSDKICLPMMLVSLLTFAQNEIVPTRKRLKFMLSIKSSLHAYSNYESVLKVPGWQTVLFKSLVLELNRRDQVLASRLSKQDGDSLTDQSIHDGPVAGSYPRTRNSFSSSAGANAAAAAVEEIDALCEVIMSIICDVHLHAICFGVPVLPSGTILSSSASPSASPQIQADVGAVQTPGESVHDRSQMISAKTVLEEVAAGTRVVGAVVLRETMIQLQSFVQDGSLNMASTGTELMKRIMISIRRETTEATGTETTETKQSRRRILEMNMWVMAAIILENFTLLPSTQFNSLYVRNRVSSPQLYELSADSGDSPSATPSKTDLQQAVIPGAGSLNSLSVDDLAVDVFSVGGLGTASSPHGSAYRSSVGNRERGSSESSPTVASMGGMARVPTEIVAPAFATPGRQALKSRQYGKVGANISQQSTSLVVWSLLESVFAMLGPLDTFSAMWSFEKNMKLSRSGTIRLQQRSGYYSGDGPDDRMTHLSPAKHVYAINVVTPHGSIPISISSSSSASAHHVSAHLSSLSVGMKGLDCQFWVFIRATLNVFIHEAQQHTESDRKLMDSSDKLRTVSALKLITLIELIQVHARDFYESEIIFIVARLVQVLRSLSSNQLLAWSKAAFSVVVKLILTERVQVIRLLILGTQLYMDKLECSVVDTQNGISAGVGTADVSGLQALVTELMDMIDVQKSMLVSTSDVVAFAEEFMNKQSHQQLSAQGNLLQEVIIRAIRRCLLPKHQPTGSLGLQQLNWAIWDFAMESRLKQGRYEEEVLLGARLTEIGLHKRIDVSELHAGSLEWVNDFKSRVDDAVTKMSTLEDRRLREGARAEDVNRRRITHNWNEILEKLANERGPWGTGAEDVNEVISICLYHSLTDRACIVC
jgi:hypothetical protein